MTINRRLMLEYRINKLEKLLNEKTIAHGVETKAFKIWKYLRDEGPKTRPEINRQFPGATNIIPDMAEKGVIRKTGQVYEYNPTYRWDDIGVISRSGQGMTRSLVDAEIDNLDDDTLASDYFTNLNDVYKALESDDSNDIEHAIKEFANDITNKQKIQNVLLAHAANANISALKLLFGDSNIKLTPDETYVYGISDRDVSAMCDRFKNIAQRLDGENGLIAQVVNNCRPETQMAYMYIIRYLMKKFNMPIEMYHFINAIKNKCYNLATYLYGKLDLIDVFTLDELLPYIDELPDELLNLIIDDLNNKESIDELGQLFIYALKNDDKLFNTIKTKVGIRTPFGKRLTQYVKDNDKEASEILSDKLLNNLMSKLNL